MTAGVPEPGLLPILAGGLIAVCGITLMLWRSAAAPTIHWAPPKARAKIYGSAAAFLLYAGLVPVLGFCATTAVLSTVLSGWWGGYRWRIAVLYGVLTAVSMLILFDLLLGVPLPRGIFFD
jgi:putative tricarboxylic transport membrane protein